jgi:hypothetical protein
MGDEILEKRQSARINSDCPILYSRASQVQWLVGMLANLSEKGICFISDTPLPLNDPILLQCKPQGDARIPKLACKAMVLRCEAANDGQYLVACQLTTINLNTDIEQASPTGQGVLQA